MDAMNPDVPDNPSPEKEVEVDPGNNPDEINLDPNREAGSEEK